MSSHQIHPLESALQDIFGFTLEDLDYNRTGAFSDSQTALLKIELKSSPSYHPAAIVIGFAVFAALFFAFDRVIAAAAVGIVIYGLTRLVMEVRGQAAHQHLNDILKDIQNPQVIIGTGELTARPAGRKNAKSPYEIPVDELHIPINEYQYELIQQLNQDFPGLEYRFYFTLQSKILLSVEPMSQDTDFWFEDN
ncbi:MAG TPA: hypothetical protein VJZ27_20500 [Aggregatilineales bacterium]|nr:hypothetical protein [Aggregatilineales bacterium]